jgi:peptide/nickel transport system ATP-binding protein
LVEISPGHLSACWVTQGGGALPRLNVHPASLVVTTTPATDAPVERSSRVLTNDVAPAASVLVEVANLTKHFPARAGSFFRQSKAVVHAVDGVDLTIVKGETLGLVGESGSGKSTLGRLIVRLQEPTSGSIYYDGIDVTHLDRRSLRLLRRRMQMVFQDPYSSLNPRMTVGDMLAEPLRVHRLVKNAAESRVRVQELLSLVRLDARVARRYPHEFSGGQRQRIGIARSLAMEPEFIVADEPVSSLDVNIQAQIINLLEDLQKQLGLTYLFIAHDLSVVKHVSNRVAVMYAGKVVELAPRFELYRRPLHPYTKILISAVPSPTRPITGGRRRIEVVGEPPNPIDLPSGCRFRTRCPIAQEICAVIEPPLIEYLPGRSAACHFPGTL